MDRADLKNIARVVSLIPIKYYLGAAGAAIVLLIYGIGRTIVTPVIIPKTVVPGKSASGPTIEAQQTITAPVSITAGNVFRRQRKEYQPPPPPPPPAAVGAQAPKEEPVPDVKLLGIIITDTKRLAIIDAELKRYVRKEVNADLVISGFKQLPISDDGKYYEITAVKGDKLASQTFHEGDTVAEFTLSKINEDSIEIVSLKNGRKTVISLETNEAAKSLSGRLAKTSPVVINDWAASGARTR